MEPIKQARQKINLDQLKPRMILVYRLLPSQAPRNPNREWRGRVMDVWISTKYNVGAVKVEVLEQGYEGDTEIVYLEQIIRFEAVEETRD